MCNQQTLTLAGNSVSIQIVSAEYYLPALFDWLITTLCLACTDPETFANVFFSYFYLMMEESNQIPLKVSLHLLASKTPFPPSFHIKMYISNVLRVSYGGSDVTLRVACMLV